MAATFSLADLWDDGQAIHVVGTIAFSGSYATGGDTLDLSGQFASGISATGGAGVPTTQPPIKGTVAIDSSIGYDFFYTYAATPTLANGKVQVFQNASAAGAFAELSAGAYPAAITGATVFFYGICPKLL